MFWEKRVLLSGKSFMQSHMTTSQSWLTAVSSMVPNISGSAKSSESTKARYFPRAAAIPAFRASDTPPFALCTTRMRASSAAKPVAHLRTAVGRAVVNEDDLNVGKSLRPERRNTAREVFFNVVYRDDYADLSPQLPPPPSRSPRGPE